MLVLFFYCVRMFESFFHLFKHIIDEELIDIIFRRNSHFNSLLLKFHLQPQLNFFFKLQLVLGLFLHNNTTCLFFNFSHVDPLGDRLRVYFLLGMLLIVLFYYFADDFCLDEVLYWDSAFYHIFACHYEAFVDF